MGNSVKLCLNFSSISDGPLLRFCEPQFSHLNYEGNSLLGIAVKVLEDNGNIPGVCKLDPLRLVGAMPIVTTVGPKR